MAAPQRENSQVSSSSSNHIAPSRSSTDSGRSPRLASAPLNIQNPSPAAQHRQSFSDSRYPSSPRSTRQPSLSSIAVQELIDNPPHRTAADPRFANRDWRTIRVGELTSPDDLRFIDINSSVEEATNVSNPPLPPMSAAR